MRPREKDALASGRRWAEAKADMLAEIPIADWPDEWDPEWNGTLLDSGAVDARTRAGLFDLATHAAAERWEQLVEARRSRDDWRADIEEQEAAAARLHSAILDRLPQGLSASRQGARVFLLDEAEEREIDVTSIEHASRAIADWMQRRGRA